MITLAMFVVALGAYALFPQPFGLVAAGVFVVAGVAALGMGGDKRK